MNITRRLSESLENKYKLDEAFDESMPEWLKKALAATAPHMGSSDRGRKVGAGGNIYAGHDGIYRNIHDPNRKYYYPGYDYQEPKKRDERPGWRNITLGQRLLNAGVDISKVVIHQGDMPKKVPKENLDIIPIFCMGNGQVYAVGINDREIYEDDTSKRPFFRVPQKTIIENATDYCYIDKKDKAITDHEVENKRADRGELRNEISSLQRYFRNAPNRYTDASGYHKRDLPYDYRDKIKELKAKHIPERFDEVCRRSDELLQTLKDFVDDASNDDLDTISNILEYISQCRYEVGYAESAKNEYYSATDDWSKERYLERTLNYLKDAENKLDSTEEYFAQYNKTVVDW